jgi:hypothetical protein
MNIYQNGSFKTDSKVNFTLSFGRDFHITVWKTMLPIILLVTLCTCILHWIGVL